MLQLYKSFPFEFKYFEKITKIKSAYGNNGSPWSSFKWVKKKLFRE